MLFRSRVTMRSNYWGQGGHNAIFIVGDFFRGALASGSLNAKAQFPHPPPRPPVIVAAADPTAAPTSAAESPAIRIRLEESQPFAVPGRSAKSAEDLARIMSGMGRDPDTGVQVQVHPARGEPAAEPVGPASTEPR